jgi:DNA-binding MarR family transcriptional regulator
MINQPAESEYLILESIYDSSSRKTPLRQRDLAHIAGTSLGMTNSILKRLAQKGWISVKKINSRNFHYAVTLEGINEIVRRGYGYFKRTIKNVVYYKESLDELIRQAKRREISAAILVGMSDLDFIIEHLCHCYGLSFLKAVDLKTALQTLDGNTLGIFAENIPETEFTENSAVEEALKKSGSVFFLSKMVMKKTAEDI